MSEIQTDGDGDLAAVAVELEHTLLGGERQWNRAQVAALAGVDEDRAQELWRALGFADVGDEVLAFTDRDVWALRTVMELGERGWLDDEAQVAMTRALGQSLARLADWQLSAVGSMVTQGGDAKDALARARELVPVVEDLMGYVWRRHLAAAAGRALSVGTVAMASTMLCVGFADLVGFTTLTRQVSEAELADLVEHFESMASDVIAVGAGRVVKMIGDEVMFIADSPEVGVNLGIELSDRVGADSQLPELRVGLAYGLTLSRLGDVYGEPVNLAARLTSFARPGSVLVDRGLADAIDGDERFRLRRVPPRPVRGYTLLTPYRVRRTEIVAGT